MEEIETVGRISIIVNISTNINEGGKGQINTLKNESPGPKTMLGRITVASGQISKTDLSASALVLTYGMLLSGSAPIALKWINLAPTSLAAFATFSAPFHWTTSKSRGVPNIAFGQKNWPINIKSVYSPCIMPTKETIISAPSKAGTRLLGLVMSTGTGGSRLLASTPWFLSDA
jgi:hypothetical protein